MAGWLAKRLGNGLFGLIDIDNPTLPPAITASISTAGLATDTNQTDGSQKTKIVDADGDVLAISAAGLISVLQSGAWSMISDRPSLKSGRTYKQAAVSNQTSTQTLYTVTAGKILYVTSIALSGYNVSAANSGIIEIRDNATLRLPVSSPVAGVGALASAIGVSSNIFTFLEPLEFSTNFNVTVVQGTLTYSCSFVGYEE